MARKRNTPSSDSPVQAFMQTCRQQWLTADTAEQKTREEGLKDLNFLNLDQWPAEIKALRESVGQERPCLTIDQIGEPYRQLTNKARDSRSAIRIIPEDGEANKDTADALQEMVRGIEYQSDAQVAYVTAFDGAAGPGWGYARLRTEYEDPTTSRDQCIKIEAIENQFAVWIDPAAKEFDRRDMRFAFIAEAMPMEAYKAAYGESLAATQGSREMFQGIGAQWQDWFPEGQVIVAEYYYRDDEKVPMVELADGTVLKKADLPKGRDAAGRFVPSPEIAHEWTADVPVVKWCKINGLEILEGNADMTAGRRIPGKTIPIRPCYGQVLNVNGVRVVRGLVRAARDPQQMYNYNNSALVEDLALVPKTKIIMAEGQEEGHEGELQQSLSSPTPYIRYKPTALGDKLVPAPQVAQFTDPAKIQSLVIAINQNKADLRSTLSYYDQTDPARANTDQSGKAQLVRKQENDEGKVGYLYWYGLFLTSIGKLIIEWIPEVYDRKGRIVSGRDMEDNPTFLMLNQPFQRDKDGRPQPISPEAMQLGNGEYEHIDPAKGKYGVRVTVGKSYLSMKQEAGENGLRLMEVLPQQAAGFADVVVRNLDGPGNDQIADRLERMVPPQIKGDEGEPETPEALKAQNAQLQQQAQEMGTVIKGLQEAVKTDQVKIEGDLQKTQMSTAADAQKASQSDAVKVQIAQMDNATKLEIEERKFAHERVLAQMKIDAELRKAELALQQARMTLSADAQGRREEFQHDDAAAEQGHVHNLEAQAAKPQPEASA